MALGIEDVDVAKCLRLVGVYPNKSLDEYGRERFHPFDLVVHYDGINGNFKIFKWSGELIYVLLVELPCIFWVVQNIF